MDADFAAGGPLAATEEKRWRGAIGVGSEEVSAALRTRADRASAASSDLQVTDSKSIRSKTRIGPLGEFPMADERHDWFLNQIFRHRAALHRYLRKFTSGAEDIEDLVQETYVRVYALPDYRAVNSSKALLFRIAHNLAVERARRQSIQATDSMADLELLSVYSSEAPPEQQIDARRRFESFCAAVDRLPPLCRRVFVLRKVYKLSHAEISEVLGVSHSTIEKHVAKGLMRCRDYLQQQGLLGAVDTTDAKGQSESLRRASDGGKVE